MARTLAVALAREGNLADLPDGRRRQQRAPPHELERHRHRAELQPDGKSDLLHVGPRRRAADLSHAGAGGGGGAARHLQRRLQHQSAPEPRRQAARVRRTPLGPVQGARARPGQRPGDAGHRHRARRVAELCPQRAHAAVRDRSRTGAASWRRLRSTAAFARDCPDPAATSGSRPGDHSSSKKSGGIHESFNDSLAPSWLALSSRSFSPVARPSTWKSRSPLRSSMRPRPARRPAPIRARWRRSTRRRHADSTRSRTRTSPLYKKSVFFDFDSFVVKSEYQPVVEAHGKYLAVDQESPHRGRGQHR